MLETQMSVAAVWNACDKQLMQDGGAVLARENSEGAVVS